MRLKEFKINHGGRFNIDLNGGLVVTVPSDVKMIGAKADEEFGKTTFLDLFLMGCGQLGGKEVIDSLVNRDSGKLEVEHTFTANDRAEIHVKITKSQFVVTRNGEEQKSPKDFLRQVLGTVATSPLWLKNAPVDDLVDWLAAFSTRGVEDFKKDMKKAGDESSKAKKSRAEFNKVAKGLREYLIGEEVLGKDGLIGNEWILNEAKFKEEPDIKKLSLKLDEAGKKSDKYLQTETNLKHEKEKKTAIEAKIAELTSDLAKVDLSIKSGEKYLLENKAAKKDYDAVRNDYDNAAKNLADYNKWQEIKKKRAELTKAEADAQKADDQEKAAIKKQNLLQWEVIPDIPGMEILLADEEERKAGFYLNGMSSRQMSASQFFGAILKILKKNKVQIVLVDNISEFGSKFMETLEGLAKSGCYILYSEMERGATEIKIQYE